MSAATSLSAVAIVSGGMDSVTLAHDLQADGFDLHLLSVNYGQRHSKELMFAQLAAMELGCDWSVVDLSGIRNLIGASSLTSSTINVPDGHYAEDTMKATVVPNRNMMMLSIAVAVAVSEGRKFVATGVHGGDHAIYPDCRPEFIHLASEAAIVGNAWADFRGILAPYIDKDKTFIAARGTELGVDFTRTWSCYKGGVNHCGACGTCFERREAFKLAALEDPTVYDALPEYADPR